MIDKLTELGYEQVTGANYFKDDFGTITVLNEHLIIFDHFSLFEQDENVIKNEMDNIKLLFEEFDGNGVIYYLNREDDQEDVKKEKKVSKDTLFISFPENDDYIVFYGKDSVEKEKYIHWIQTLRGKGTIENNLSTVDDEKEKPNKTTKKIKCTFSSSENHLFPYYDYSDKMFKFILSYVKLSTLELVTKTIISSPEEIDMTDIVNFRKTITDMLPSLPHFYDDSNIIANEYYDTKISLTYDSCEIRYLVLDTLGNILQTCTFEILDNQLIYDTKSFNELLIQSEKLSLKNLF